MGVFTLDPVTDGAFYVEYNGTAHTRILPATLAPRMRWDDTTPTVIGPRRHPVFIFPYDDLVGQTITKVEFLWTLASASAAAKSVGIGFLGALDVGDTDADFDTACMSVGAGEATEAVDSGTLGPFATDLGAGAVTEAQAYVDSALNIPFGFDLAPTETEGWIMVFSAYQLRVTTASAGKVPFLNAIMSSGGAEHGLPLCPYGVYG